MPHSVIPAKAGIQWGSEVCAIAFLDPRVRGDDEAGDVCTGDKFTGKSLLDKTMLTDQKP
jgi:hypothetical protein